MEERSPGDDDIIKLNIGGEKHVTVKRNTLMQAEGSLLEAMFRGTWDQSLDRDEDSNVFIDQSPALFLPLVNYMRTCRDETPNGPRAQPPQNLGPAFDTMVEYYGMTKFVYRLELRALSMPPPHDATITNKHNHWSISSPNEWVTIDLHQIGHHKKITKYTVVMGSFSHARIGWRDTAEEYPVFDKSPENKSSERIINPSKGVGDFNGTVAFECHKDGVYPSCYVNGQISTADGHICDYPLEGKDAVAIADIEEGTKIECLLTPPKDRDDIYQAERPVWVVNDNLLDSFVTWRWAPRGSALPCISIRGNLEIIDVEFDTAVDVEYDTAVQNCKRKKTRG